MNFLRVPNLIITCIIVFSSFGILFDGPASAQGVGDRRGKGFCTNQCSSDAKDIKLECERTNGTGCASQAEQWYAICARKCFDG
jgi:hypothetical protein